MELSYPAAERALMYLESIVVHSTAAREFLHDLRALVQPAQQVEWLAQEWLGTSRGQRIYLQDWRWLQKDLKRTRERQAESESRIKSHRRLTRKHRPSG